MMQKFADIDENTRHLLMARARRRVLSPGDTVFRQGADGADGGMFVVQAGWLKVAKVSPDGREQILQVLGPGDVFNSLGMFVAAPNPASVVALEEVTLWEIPADTMQTLIKRDPQLAWQIILLLADRLLHLTNLVEDLSLRTVEARVARLLLEQANEGVLDRHRWATQTEMAARMGTVPDVLNRVLRTLAGEQLIRVDRHRIVILNETGLAAKAF